MSSWSERLYQNLILSARPRPQHPHPLSNGRQIRQLLRRILRQPAPVCGGAGGFGFESPPPAAARLSPHPQAVLVAWRPASGHHLSPSCLRAALIGNFVLLINRAFGHNAEAVASVALPPSPGAPDDPDRRWRRRLLAEDIGILGLQRCRLEAEDCYARETHRLARVLRSLPRPVPGSELWCDRRLRDLLAALARAERSACHRLHWVAGPDEAGRLADLSSGLRQLGYGRLASPAPWPLHVDVGPVTVAAAESCGGSSWRRAADLRPEDLLRLCGSRDDLLLRLMSPLRASPLALTPPPPPSGHHRHLAPALRRCRARLADCGFASTAEADFDRLFDDVEDEDRTGWSQAEAALARHLADFPEAAAAAYLAYEPRPIVFHLGGLVRLLTDAVAVDSDGRRAGRWQRAATIAASLRVLNSACGVLGLSSQAEDSGRARF